MLIIAVNVKCVTFEFNFRRVEPFNPTLSNAWVNEGAAPALPESLNLYKKLLSLGIKIVFLTGRTENQRDVTARNLKRAGYHTWEKLVLKYCIYLFITPSSSPSWETYDLHTNLCEICSGLVSFIFVKTYKHRFLII